MIIYDRETKLVVAQIPESQTMETFLFNFPPAIQDKMAAIEGSISIEEIMDYKVEDGKLIRLSEVEYEEGNIYNRILKEYERADNAALLLITPTAEEVRKAQNVVDVLSILTEVL